jgi:hypothetical protein
MPFCRAGRGLVAAINFLVVWNILMTSPPFNLTHWHAGRAFVGLAGPLLLVVYGFYVSLGSRRMLGNVLNEQ